MVACEAEPEGRGGGGRSRRSSGGSGFRLLDADQCETGSVTSRQSVCKLKIDSMFDDSRSVISQRLLDVQAQLHEPRVSNSVQARIERMFSDVIYSSGGTEGDGASEDATSCGAFPVRWLGALPLLEKVTSLDGLQEPLRQLYAAACRTRATLDVCQAGLRLRKIGCEQAQVTPFSGIAVWSAVKFVVDPEGASAAFLPLITDPDSVDKRKLFRPLSQVERRASEPGPREPLFAVVMRASAAAKRLECHGFICDTSEDAIVLAATLYRALMSHMSSAAGGGAGGRSGGGGAALKPRNRNGVSCVSIASSSGGGTTARYTQPPRPPVSNGSGAGPAVPVRPPRKKRSAASSLSGDSSCRGGVSLTDISKESLSSAADRKKRSSKTNGSNKLPSTSDIYSASMNYLNEQSRQRGQQNNPPLPAGGPADSQYSGDILTRVAIPRSGSFLNAGGLARYKTRAQRRTGLPGGGGGSPLGFNELFAEFRLQENLHSLDEILGAIVDADGMSFNDLKPIYKEFLLKLAVTLTKDELYQRSKSIMRRQKKKKKKNQNQTCNNPVVCSSAKIMRDKRKRSSGSCGNNKGLRRVFRFRHHNSKSDFEYIKNKKKSHCDDSCETGPANRNSSSGYVSCSECSYDSESCTCASADRCYCSLGNTQARTSVCCCSEGKCCRSASNTASSSAVCECDSDSCLDQTTKCYCRRKTAAGTGKDEDGETARGSDRLALDYELFTTNGIDMPIERDRNLKPHEAMSVKKSAEMAALFADVKLNQTTDVTHLIPGKINGKSSVKSAIYTINSQTDKLAGTGTRKTDMLCNVEHQDINQLRRSKAVSGSLEDSLGYLP